MKIIFTALLLITIASTITYSTPTTFQGNWRWRNDDGNESGASFIEAENTGFALSDTGNIRLRLEIYVWNDYTSNDLVGIYYSTSSDATSGIWTQITDDNSNDFVISPSAYFTDQDAASSNLLSQVVPERVEVPGLMIDSSLTFLLSLNSNRTKEFEICFKATENILLNTQYYFSVRDLEIYALLPSLTTAALLPVELTSFTAKAVGTSVRLDWMTAAEKNNYGFEVQRQVLSQQSSAGSKEFETIGFVKGNGNSSSIKKYSYTDVEINEGNYSYRLKQIDNDGKFEYSQIIEITFPSDGGQSMKPDKFALEQNYPNPFNPSTEISYSITQNGKVRLALFNLLGEEVKILVDETKEAGTYHIKFNSSGLSSGVYLYTLEAGGLVQSKKLTVLK